ncbi:hypothetical protein RYX36_022343, partial [Vicia faba]
IPVEAKIDFSFKLYGLNGDGVIEHQEVIEMLVVVFREFQHEPTHEELDYILDKTFLELYGLNGDGVIERQEVREMLVVVFREFQHEPTDEELDYILDKTFLEVDTNKDGIIDIDEWRVYVNQNHGAIRIMTIPYLRE